jgi:NSS family neurotransmitter:Na+ symporter
MVVGCSYLLGIPSARNLNILSNQDFVWGVALMISGAFVAFTIVRNGARQIRTVDLADPGDWTLKVWWERVITYFIPIAAFILLVWWLVQSASTERWYNPLESFSIMTCLVQWTLIIVILLLLNRWMNQRMVDRVAIETEV